MRDRWIWPEGDTCVALTDSGFAADYCFGTNKLGMLAAETRKQVTGTKVTDKNRNSIMRYDLLKIQLIFKMISSKISKEKNDDGGRK